MPPTTLVRPLPDLDAAAQPEAPATAADWEERRSKFRHDWLKNTFLNRVDSFLSLLDAPNPRPQYLWEFVEEDLRTWPEKSAEAHVLIDAYRDRLSPEVLVDRDPLCRLDDDSRQWLGEVADALWEARTNPEATVEQARTALERVGALYTQLAEDLVDAESPDDLKALRPTFDAFRQACSELSEDFGSFQRSIQVT